jgi:hypothetical protein
VSTKEHKKEEESFLKRFVELDNKSYEGFEIIQDDPPDGILKFNGYKISVEISKLFTKHGKRVIQERKFVEEVCKVRLKQESLKWSQNKFSVHWRFDFPFDFSARRREQILSRMLNIVEAGLEKMKMESVLEIEPENLPPEIDHLSICKSQMFQEPNWSYENYWMSGELSEEQLWHKINRKNQKALDSKYYSAFDQNWLLLVIEEKPHSSFAGFADDGYKVKNDWVFDRIIIMEPINENRLYDVI